MVIVAHVVLENSSVLPNSTLQCTLELLNTPKNALRTIGPYDSNLLSLFKLQSLTTSNEESQEYVEKEVEEEDDFLSQLTSKTYYTKQEQKTKPNIPDLQLASTTDSEKHQEMWTLDFLYAQVYGLAIADSGWLHPLPFSSSPVSFNDASAYTKADALPDLIAPKKNSQLIFASHPKRFPQYQRANLHVNEKKVMQFSMQVPSADALPPSYKGKVLSYAYFVAVGLGVSNKREGSRTKVIKLPFKVYNPLSCITPVGSRMEKSFLWQWQFQQEYVTTHNAMLRSASIPSSSVENIDSMTNMIQNLHSLQGKVKQSSLFYVYEAIEQELVQNSATKHYNVANGDQLVCKFSMKSTAFQLGDTILGIFDFTKSTVKCSKVQCDLLFEELVLGSLVKIGQVSSPDKHIRMDANLSQTSVASFEENTAHTLSTNCHIMIPPFAPAQFQSELVSVKWFLKLVFTLQTAEVFEWTLPIQVFVPSDFRPLHTHSQSKDVCVLCE